MATYTKFNSFTYQLGLKTMDLSATGDVLKLYLTNTLPVITDTVFGTPADISSGNGYTAGGDDITNTWTESPAGTGLLNISANTWTASGGAIAQFRYVVLYNDTSTSKHLIGWWDYGSAIDLADTETFDSGAATITIA